ncbi:hypothetical protein LMG29739_04052 [Paraburkholderia solisilvae]|uniref:Uncharacterized protein n=1 Tax=Paraburkholderia solisilvae TaxID=624376 RepID=A0A6J5ED91_9BURK|nr:hypothetical protein LMG29739_04052 [Paraburkholderia solisilvae]
MRAGRGTRRRRIAAGRTSLLLALALVGQRLEHVVEHRDKEHRDRGRAEHPADHAGTDRMPAVGRCAGGDRKRHAAENERERGHHDRPQTLFRRDHRRIENGLAALAVQHRELEDQNRILRGERNQHRQADLEVHVVVEPAQQDREQRAEQRERHRHQHAERQVPLLVLCGKDQEHHHDAEREHEPRGAARLLRFIRFTAPRERVALRHLRADFLERLNHLP